ncbi:MAG: Omp28-related outer membrane protein [Saprospiraceae bacterium]|nr:Omp28-related outer membrane protein [Candidatus Defluviibacterium haderslevense]
MSKNPTEIASQVTYYNVTGVPTIVGNGKSLGQPGAVTQTYMNTESAKTTGIKITVDHNVTFNLDSVYITGVVENVNTASVTGSDFRLHVALVEHLIAFNDPPGNNGETEFRDVVRKLAYGPDGSPLSSGAITPGKKFPFTIAMAIWNISMTSNIAVIAFVQTKVNKTVHQSEISLPKALPNNPNFRDISLADLSEVPSLAKGFCANDVNLK